MIINNYVTISIAIILICGGFTFFTFQIDKEEIYACISSGIVMGAIVGVILSFIGMFICVFTDNRIETQYTTQSDLVALNDFTGNKSSISGGFFLCVGGISGSSSDTYNVRYASKDDNEVIKINTIEVNNDNIGFVEDENTEVVITHKKIEYKYNKVGEWLFGHSVTEFSDEEIGYEFHVPKGSITNDIEVDLK